MALSFDKFKEDTGASTQTAQANALYKLGESMRSNRSLNKARKSIEAKARGLRSQAAVGSAKEKAFDDAVSRVSGKSNLSIKMGAKRDAPEEDMLDTEGSVDNAVTSVSSKLGVTGVQA